VHTPAAVTDGVCTVAGWLCSSKAARQAVASFGLYFFAAGGGLAVPVPVPTTTASSEVSATEPLMLTLPSRVSCESCPPVLSVGARVSRGVQHREYRPFGGGIPVFESSAEGRYFAVFRIVLYACPTVRYLGPLLAHCRSVGYREYRACGGGIPVFGGLAEHRNTGMPGIPHPWATHKACLPVLHDTPMPCALASAMSVRWHAFVTVPPTQLSDPQESPLSETMYALPSGHVHSPAGFHIRQGRRIEQGNVSRQPRIFLVSMVWWSHQNYGTALDAAGTCMPVTWC